MVREWGVRFMSPASGWLASTGTVPNTHTHLHILELLSVVREWGVRFMSPASGWLASTGTVPNTDTQTHLANNIF